MGRPPPFPQRSGWRRGPSHPRIKCRGRYRCNLQTRAPKLLLHRGIFSPVTCYTLTGMRHFLARRLQFLLWPPRQFRRPGGFQRGPRGTARGGLSLDPRVSACCCRGGFPWIPVCRKSREAVDLGQKVAQDPPWGEKSQAPCCCWGSALSAGNAAPASKESAPAGWQRKHHQPCFSTCCLSQEGCRESRARFTSLGRDRSAGQGPHTWRAPKMSCVAARIHP